MQNSQQQGRIRRRSTVFIFHQEEENEIDSITKEFNLPDFDESKINESQAKYRSGISFAEATSQYMLQLQSEAQDIQNQQNNTIQQTTNQTIQNAFFKNNTHTENEDQEIFERSSTRKMSGMQSIINPESKRLKQILKENNFTIEQLEGEAFLHLANVLIQNQSCNEKGKLLITNYRFAFFIGNKLKVDVALGYIERLTTKQQKSTVLLQIYLKHSPVWRFRYENKKQGQQSDSILNLYAFPIKLSYFFAFSHYKSFLKKPEIVIHYQFEKQYSRIGMLQNNKYKKLNNFDGSLCSTYPSQVIVPCEASEELIRSVAKSRERQRFPVATYCVKTNNNVYYTLWRSSQLKSSDNKSLNDVQYINMLSYWSPLIIIEARTKQNSKDNIQTSQLYKDCTIQYLNLQPITSIKNSYYKIIETCIGTDSKKFIKDLNDSKWYQQVKNVLVGATIIADYLICQKNVLIHCGDGWDRTSQLSALALLLIDPYFRTLDGFAVLIQKQFISFGDPFYLRLGLKGRSEQQIPLFIQFLDCVVQIINQYPLSFQFTIKYITLLSNYIYTNRFGNFLATSRQQSYQYKLRQNTLSIWQQLKKDPLAINSFYLNVNEIGLFQLNLNLQSKSLRFWRQHFFYLTTNLKDVYKMHPYAQDNHDYLKLLHDQLKKQTDSYRKKVSQQFKCIMSLKQQLQQINNPKIMLEEIQ